MADPYVTQTGMKIDTSHAYFKLPIADKVFNTINVQSYQPLQEAIAQGVADSDTRLVVFEVGKQTLSIPLVHIGFHHVAQGKLNDTDWAVTFCSCCNMGTSINPIIHGKVHHFTGTGVYHGMAIFRDDETGSYWEHMTGECIHGDLQGTFLESVTTRTLLAKQVIESTPDALIVTAKQAWWQRLLSRLSMGDILSEKGHIPAPFKRSFGKKDERLSDLQLGLGVWADGKARFYSLEKLRENQNALLDTFSQQSMVVLIDPASQTPFAYQTDATSFSWKGNRLVLDTGEHIHNGYVMTDTGEKRVINNPKQQFVRWFAFSFKFPNCEIYSG